MERPYYQALQALRSSVFSGKEFVSFLDETELSDYKMRYLAGKEEVLIQRFKMLNEKECFDTIDEMFLWVFKNLSMDFGVVKNYVMGIVALVIKTASEMVIGKNMATTFLSRDYYGEISLIGDLWNLKKWFEHTVTEIIDAVKDTQQKKLMKVIEQAKAYIADHYTNDLTLEIISEQINVSQTHFSRIFKLETGLNFVDYLTKVRLDKAIELLKATDMTIKQICFEVGFNDPNYFSKVFKKVLGVTPGEYKNNIE
jgi:two-component system response regulator YesN